MSESPVRQSRRTAGRRRPVIDDSDDELLAADTTKHSEDGEAEFTPAPSESPKRKPASRRTTDKVKAAPRTRTLRAIKKESVEPSEIFDVENSMIQQDPESPLKNPVARKPRKSAAPVKRSRASATPDLGTATESRPVSSSSSLPTPKPSASPEPSLIAPGTPLADITKSLNDRPRTVDSQITASAMKPLRPMDTLLEKPMDIVLKSRSQSAPVLEETGPKARLVITYLILTNFKSYAGRQEVGPFHASFSSVVGPNGSGKSNVIDSLLFVFGFRASKMRQGKISALIHNSAAFPDLDHCEVAVHFQEVMDKPNGPSQVIPGSDLVISRRAFKNNSSKYYMNGKESNFTTVTTLLRERGVDLDHKRFLILQGEVESIAQMKPKAANEHDDGLLEYLEDIIGTSKYKTPIEESAAEVEAMNEICVEKSGRVQHVEKEKNSLEDKKNKALAFIKDENELATKQSSLYQIYIHECGNNINVTEEALVEIEKELEAELEKHKGNEDDMKQVEREYKKGHKEYDMLDKETQAILQEMAKFEQEHVKFEEKKKFLSTKQKKAEKMIHSSEASTTEAASTIEACTAAVAESTEQIAALEKQMEVEEKELNSIRESLRGKTQAFSDQITSKQKSLEPWKEKLNQKQSAIAVAESELAILHEKANAGAVNLEETRAKIALIEQSRADKLAELEAATQEKAKLEKYARKTNAKLDELAKREPEFRSVLSATRQKADEARASLSATQSQGNVLAGLMRLKESGRIEGFHGRLGNLGTIDAKYDIAISTACGALDNFVTDTVEAGQQCIEYLRKTNLGRGNFMCLDKLGNREILQIETPENVPRLFDLIKAKDAKFLPAFYHSLQNTLVAKDLDQANRIAYGAKRWRVVTLDGKLIDKSGTMSGGGNTVKKGLMSSKLVADTTTEQVQRMELDRDALEQEFAAFQSKFRDYESDLRKLNEEIPLLETKIQKLGLELESSGKNIADAERRVKELSKEHHPSKTDNNRVSTLEKEIAKLNRDVEKLHGEMASVEDEIKALQDKIMAVGGEKLRAQKVQVDALKEQIDDLNETVSTAEIAKVKAEKVVTKVAKDQAKAEKELATTIADLEALELAVDEQTSNAEGYQARVDEAKVVLQDKKASLAALKSELDEKTAAQNELRALEIEIRNKVEENQKVLHENQKRLKYWHEKSSKLILQSIADLSGEPGPAVESPSDQLLAEQNDNQGRLTPESEEDDEEDTLRPSSELTSTQLGLPQHTPDELSDMSKETLKAEIAALEEKTQNQNIDLGVLSEYRKRVHEHTSRLTDLNTAVSTRDTAKKRCDELRRLRLEGFMQGFSLISLRLKEMYQMITMGGNAELELVDSLDPFSEGILFSVMPPKKSWKNISNLSGGEKTLSSLALVFALHHYKPTPLYVMDEIDAALDFRNVSIVASYIRERTKNAQFIVISLRNNMFELASRLVGVYKVNHMTKSVTIENRDYINERAATAVAGTEVLV